MRVYQSEQELVDALSKKKNIYIYGKGLVGSLLSNRLKSPENSFYGLNVCGFVDRDNTSSIYMGLPVYKLEQVLGSSPSPSPFYVIAVKEETQHEIETNLQNNKVNESNYCGLTDACIREMFMNQSRNGLNLIKRIDQLEESLLRLTPRPVLQFGFHLTDACNLNCKGCFHFAPLAKHGPDMWMANIAEFEEDIKRLKELTCGELSSMSFLGGEPLLHPQVHLFPYIVKKYFPETFIEFLTNGILLPKMNEIFWESIEKNEVNILWTKYPIDPQKNKEIEQVLKEKCRNFLQYNPDDNKMLGKRVYDFEARRVTGARGRNDARWQWIHCGEANLCIQLRNHKLYPCSDAAYASILVDYFGIDVNLSEFNGIDIYKAKDLKEVMEFLSRPIPFCRYCRKDKNIDFLEFEISKKSISEWT